LLAKSPLPVWFHAAGLHGERGQVVAQAAIGHLQPLMARFTWLVS
jgi:hypothetical protein